MKRMKFAEAIDNAIAHAMSEDKRIIIMGEDAHMLRANIYARFGPERVKSTPISESAFLQAGVAAAMGGLHPIVEIMLVDFLGVTMDAVLNHATKIPFFSGNKWEVPLVIRTACGGGYGDAGQHEQSLWGWLAHIPGINIVVPSNPSDAGGLMLAALTSPIPTIYFEHKLLADYWLDYLGIGGRTTVSFKLPSAGIEGEVPDSWTPLPIGRSNCIREGTDISILSIGIGVHQALEAAELLITKGINAEVLDLRWIVPLDLDRIVQSVRKTSRLLVIDEDYKQFGLSAEICASLLELGIKFKFGRVCTETTIPYSLEQEIRTLPNLQRIKDAIENLMK